MGMEEIARHLHRQAGGDADQFDPSQAREVVRRDAEAKAANTLAGKGMGLIPDTHEQKSAVPAYDQDAPGKHKRRRRHPKPEPTPDPTPDPSPEPDQELRGQVDQKFLPEIWNQLNLGSCTQFASQRCVQFVRAASGFGKMLPSFLFGYWYTRYDEGGPSAVNEDTGASITAAVEATAKHGTAPAELWPYEVSKFREKPPQAAADAAEGKQTVAQFAIGDGDVAGIIAALKEKRPDGGTGYPVAIGIPVFEGAFNAIDSDGVIPDPKSDDKIAGYHAIACVEWDNTLANHTARPLLGFDNSWGDDFGKHGRFYLTQDFVKRYGFDFRVIKQVEADQAA